MLWFSLSQLKQRKKQWKGKQYDGILSWVVQFRLVLFIFWLFGCFWVFLGVGFCGVFGLVIFK